MMIGMRITGAFVIVSGICRLGEAVLPCDPLPAPSGVFEEIRPDQAFILRQKVASAPAGKTFLLHDGLYDLSCGDSNCRLVFDTPNVSLRGFSGDRDAVVLDGNYLTNELVSIYASGIVIADLTLKRAYDHPIHISGPASPISGVLIHNVHIVDPGQQAIKINPDATGLGVLADGVIECSRLELTTVGRTQIRDGCYTGGIDGHATENLVVRRNSIEGFWCNDGLSEHGIHLWKACSGTVVEENHVFDCARGIGFGLGYGTSNGHVGGIIRSNFVGASSSGLQGSPDGFDTGIGLESASDAQVYHNTVLSTSAPASSSIEWRWDITTATVSNNLTSHGLLPRDGASAVLEGNITGALAAWFFDPTIGDLHLVADDLPPVGVAAILTAGLADTDVDGVARDGSPDVGADEYGYPVFIDDFELGSLIRWSETTP